MFDRFTRRQLFGGLIGLCGVALGRRPPATAPTPAPAPRTPPVRPVAYSYTSSDGSGLVTAYSYDGGGLASVRPAPLVRVTTYTYGPEAGR